MAAAYCASRVEAVAGPRASRDGKTLLALNPRRFRGDLEILAASGFRVLKLPFDVTTRLWRLAYDAGDPLLEKKQPGGLADRQRDFRQFLGALLQHFYAKVPVSAVLSAAVHYRHEHDWGVVGDGMGVPFLVLHRENLVASAGARQRLFERMRGYRPFEGTAIAVHNPLMRDLLSDSGYVERERVSVLGALRMDRWLAEAGGRAAETELNRKQTVAFFSFGPAAGVIGAARPQWPPNEHDYMRTFCRRAHAAILEFAAENPNVQVVVKPKWGGDWPEKLHAIWREHGLEKPENLVVDSDIDAQRLILGSDVIVAFNSTVLLEAGILGKPVVLPLFDEAATARWRDFIMFHEEREAFDVAESPEDLKSRITALLAAGPVAEHKMALRKTLFAAYVSPLDGGVADAYRAWIAHPLAAGKT